MVDLGKSYNAIYFVRRDDVSCPKMMVNASISASKTMVLLNFLWVLVAMREP